MAPYAEIGVLAGGPHRILKRRASSHEGGGGEQSACMRFTDAAIDAAGKPKIIRIRNQPTHRGSVAGGVSMPPELSAALLAAEYKAMVGRAGLEPATSCL